MSTYVQPTSCRNLARGLERIAKFHKHSNRPFSCSAIRPDYSTYPRFVESSSRELDTVLSNLRYKHILPYYLAKEQKQQLERAHRAKRAEADGVTFRVGGVTEKVDRARWAQPGTRDGMIKDVLAKAQTTEDWQNVYKLLEGFEGCHHDGRLTQRYKWRLISALYKAQQLGLFVEAIINVKRSGVSLADSRVLSSVLRLLDNAATEARTDAEQYKALIGHAEHLIFLSETKEHMPKLRATSPKNASEEKPFRIYPRRHPALVAQLLKLFAESPEARTNDATKGKVRTYATRLVALLESDALSKFKRDVPASEKERPKDVPASIVLRNLRMWLIVLDALSASQRVLGADFPTSKRAQKLTRDVIGSWQDGLRETLRTDAKAKTYEEVQRGMERHSTAQ